MLSLQVKQILIRNQQDSCSESRAHSEAFAIPHLHDGLTV
uniref:Uncharacterized protein n=1 Tax=Yersinia enterocolitica W22703 TaxID=913028 RepID=F4N7H6_YEREN|nr:unknown protein [Yersinia enterocolitica W22703]